MTNKRPVFEGTDSPVRIEQPALPVSQQPTLAPTLSPLQALFLQRSKNAAAADQNRAQATEGVLTKAAGVYRKGKKPLPHLQLDNTVLITMVAANLEVNSHYAIFLQNFLCFAEHHQLKPIVYLMSYNTSNMQRQVRHIRSRGALAHTYPEALFWRTVSTKESPILYGPTYGKYDAEYPDFHSYGALVMLIPVLEALLHGYNVIFLDVDVALVHDPVPFILRGTADMTMSMEPRGCQDYYSSAYPRFFDWERAEPNTGVMHVRSTVTGIKLYREWLALIVESNLLNDQRVYHRHILSTRYDSSCHSTRFIRSGDPASAVKPGLNSSLAAIPERLANDKLVSSYCFLDELLFQNGLIGVSCPSKKQFRDEWVAQMAEYALSDGTAHYPVILHVNYVNDKVKELHLRGLWLVKGEEYLKALQGTTGSMAHNGKDNPFCVAYDVQKTYYGQMNWTAEVADGRNRMNYFKDNFIQPGKLVKSIAAPSVFLIGTDLMKHEIPDKETFDVKFGGNFDLVAVIPSAAMMHVPLGDPVPRPTAEELQAIKDKEEAEKAAEEAKKSAAEAAKALTAAAATVPPVPVSSTPVSPVQALHDTFKSRAVATRDPKRFDYVDRVLADAAGVYRKQHAAPAGQGQQLRGLDRTVIVMVFQGKLDDSDESRLMKNFLCFAEHYGMKPVVYFLHHQSANVLNDWQLLQSRGAYTLSYPESLFWNILATKKTPVSIAKGSASYFSSLPEVGAFGDLVNLLPVLEVLYHGYNAILLHPEMIMVRDPVPYLLRANTDMQFAFERGCQDYFTSDHPEFTDWSKVEPTSGLAVVRSTEPAIATYRQWLELLVRDNKFYAKKAFDRANLHLEYDSSCHISSGLFDSQYGISRNRTAELEEMAAIGAEYGVGAVRNRTSMPHTHKHSHHRHRNGTAHKMPATYCFLDEILFTNHFGSECGNRHYRDEWLLGMHRLGIRGSNNDGRYPAVLYTGDMSNRIKELDKRGLWLAKEEAVANNAEETEHDYSSRSNAAHCAVFNEASTVYGKVSWEAELKDVRERRHQMEAEHIKKGSLVKSMSRHSTFYIDEQLLRHLVPDRDTFVANFGEEWGRIKNIPMAVANKAPLGLPLTKPVATDTEPAAAA